MRIFFLIAYLFSFFLSNAQEAPAPTGDVGQAKTYLSYFMYGPALAELKLAYKKKPEDEKINELLAQCYLNTNEDKSKAIPFLEFVIKKGKYESRLLYDLARAYHINNEFDKALEYYNRYKVEGKPKNLEEVDRDIENVHTAKELMKKPLSVSFFNLGKEVNTEYPEMTPFVPQDESYILYSTKRKGTNGNIPSTEGFEADIFISELKNTDKWSKAKSMGPNVSMMYGDEITSLSPEGNYMVYTSFDDLGLQQMIKICYKGPKSRAFDKPQIPPAPINDPKSAQVAGTVSNDGQLLIFSSDRAGGFGGLDLYLSKRLPNNSWGEPINLGSKINTKYDESYPNFSVDQNVLLFASEGHTNMGGFDIFKTTFSEETHTWNIPTNLGYPINTTDNDYTICYNKSGRNAYLSRTRKEGWGNTDVYQAVFNKVEPEYSVISVYLKLHEKYARQVKVADSLIVNYQSTIDGGTSDQNLVDSLNLKIEKLKNLKRDLDTMPNNLITVTELNKNKPYGEYQPNLKTGRFVMILEPGFYEITIENPKYKTTKTKITVLDKSNFVSEKSMDIIFHKGELDVATSPVK